MPPIRLYLRIGLVSFLAKREQSEGRRPELFWTSQQVHSFAQEKRPDAVVYSTKNNQNIESKQQLK